MVYAVFTILYLSGIGLGVHVWRIHCYYNGSNPKFTFRDILNLLIWPYKGFKFLFIYSVAYYKFKTRPVVRLEMNEEDAKVFAEALNEELLKRSKLVSKQVH